MSEYAHPVARMKQICTLMLTIPVHRTHLHMRGDCNTCQKCMHTPRKKCTWTRACAPMQQCRAPSAGPSGPFFPFFGRSIRNSFCLFPFLIYLILYAIPNEQYCSYVSNLLSTHCKSILDAWWIHRWHIVCPRLIHCWSNVDLSSIHRPTSVICVYIFCWDNAHES